MNLSESGFQILIESVSAVLITTVVALAIYKIIKTIVERR